MTTGAVVFETDEFGYNITNIEKLNKFILNSTIIPIHNQCLCDELCRLLQDEYAYFMHVEKAFISDKDSFHKLLKLTKDFSIKTINFENGNKSSFQCNQNRKLFALSAINSCKLFFQYYFQDLKMGKIFSVELNKGDLILMDIKSSSGVQFVDKTFSLKTGFCIKKEEV